jgi:hypothetical protein
VPKARRLMFFMSLPAFLFRLRRYDNTYLFHCQ